MRHLRPTPLACAALLAACAGSSALAPSPQDDPSADDVVDPPPAIPEGLAFVARDALVATAGDTVVWSLRSGAVTTRWGMATPINRVTSVATDDVGQIAMGERDGRVRVRHLDGTLIANVRVRERGPGIAVESTLPVALRADGSLVASAVDSRVMVFALPGGDRMAELEARADVTALAFSPDGSTLAVATGYRDGAAPAIEVWDVESQERRRVFDDVNAQALLFSNDGDAIVATGYDQTVLLPFEGPRRSLGAGATAVAMTASGVALAGRQGAIEILSLTTFDRVAIFDEHVADGAIAFSPNGRTFVTGPDLRNTGTWRTERTIATTAKAALFSPDGAKLASGGDKLQLWSGDGRHDLFERSDIEAPQQDDAVAARRPPPRLVTDGARIISSGGDRPRRGG